MKGKNIRSIFFAAFFGCAVLFFSAGHLLRALSPLGYRDAGTVQQFVHRIRPGDKDFNLSYEGFSPLPITIYAYGDKGINKRVFAYIDKDEAGNFLLLISPPIGPDVLIPFESAYPTFDSGVLTFDVPGKTNLIIQFTLEEGWGYRFLVE